MQYLKILSSFAVAALACAAVPAVAAPPPPPPGMMPPPPPPHMMHAPPLPMLIQSQAHLTPEQNDKIRMIMEAHRGQIVSRHADDRALDDKISAALLTKGDVDKKAVVSLVKQKIALHEQAEQQRVVELIAIHDVLTPTQREAVKNAYDAVGKLTSQLRDLMAPPPPPAP